MLQTQAPAAARSRRRRAGLALVAAVLLVHAALLGGLDGMPGAAVPEQTAALSVRTIAAAPEAAVAPAATEPEPIAASPAIEEPAAQMPVAPPARPQAPRTSREPASAAATTASRDVTATEPPPSASTAVAMPAPEPVPSPPPGTSIAGAAPSAPAVSDPAPTATVADEPPAPASAPLVAPGDAPPPVYRTQLPPNATLRYEARRGFFRGTGEIRWRRDGDRYGLTLEARIAGLTLLKWASDGSIDAAGLAPERFLDQRARRAPQAANFQRDLGKITFSGPKTEWPLLPGSQDELSWMIQLAGIAAAEPQRLEAGGRVTMVVVGARGDARVWTLRSLGRETVDTAAGPVEAVKLVRDNIGPFERGYEIWLDPKRAWLPAHVTQRKADGTAELDLLLEHYDATP